MSQQPVTPDHTDLPDVPEASGTTTTVAKEDVFEAMKDVVDPELGINVVDLGLVYDVHIDEARAAVDLARKKFRTSASVPEPRLTRRVAAALARKGYGPDITWQAVRQVKEELGDDEW